MSCHRNFQFPRQLVKHQHTTGHHNWQVVCGECNKRFKHRRFLARHTAASCKRHKLELAKANEGYDGNVAT
uniref:C2H2-type domain-containing protein n=1 Tax=Anopheles minimus TaxID=112268 RepID=A0A182W7M4_9DIPT